MKDPLREKKKRLQKNAYLEELGIPRRQCGTNFTRSTKIMRKERKKYGFDRRETYVLGDTFAQWLFSHLKMFLDVADRRIDLDSPYTTIMCDGKECTLRQAVLRVLVPLRDCLVRSRDPMQEAACEYLLKKAAHRWADIAPHVSW